MRTEIVEAMARALIEHQIRLNRKWDASPEELEAMLPCAIDYAWRERIPDAQAAYDAHLSALEAMGLAVVPVVPSEAMWGGLARAIMMWLSMNERPTPAKLFRHLEMTGEPIPQWLRDEPEMQALDHVPSKGTRCVLIYTAMLAARGV